METCKRYREDGIYLCNSLERRDQEMELTLSQDGLESWVEPFHAIRTYMESEHALKMVTGWHTGKKAKVCDRRLSLSIGVEVPSVVCAIVRKAALLDGEFILTLNGTSVEYEERRAIVRLPFVQVGLDAVFESEWTSCSGHQRLVCVFENEAEVIGRVDSNDVLFQLRRFVCHGESVDEPVIVLDCLFETG